jgi:hypothetical protein
MQVRSIETQKGKKFSQDYSTKQIVLLLKAPDFKQKKRNSFRITLQAL